MNETNKYESAVPPDNEVSENGELSVVQIKFNSGGLTVIREIDEYVSGKRYFFLARNNGEDVFAFNRDTIESVKRRNKYGKYQTVKLKKVD